MASMTNSSSSFSMRRFMTHRRTGSEDSDILSSDEYEVPFDRSSRKMHQRGSSWLPSVRRKEPPAPVMIRRGESIHLISSPLPPVPGDLPHSSTSSLCSCERHELNRPESRNSCSKNKAAKMLGMSDAHARRSSVRPKRPARPRHGLLSPETEEFPEKEEKEEKEEDDEPRPSSAASASGENSNSDKRDFAKVDSESKASASRRKTSEWSDDVQQLIMETDQAFKDVGSAFSESNMASLDFELPEAPVPDPIVTRDTEERRPSASSTKSKEQQRQRPRPTSTGSVAKNAAVTKPQAKTRPANPKKPVKPAARLPKSNGMVSRWNLSENVADILTGQRFKKIEADEMLTPARIEELSRAREEVIRQKALEATAPRSSGESSKSSDSTHGSSLDKAKPLLEETAKVEKKASTESARTSSPVEAEGQSDEDVVRSDFSQKKTPGKGEDRSTSKDIDTSEEDGEDESSDYSDEEADECPDFIMGDIASPVSPITPPPKNPARFTADFAGEAASKVPPLPPSRRASAIQRSKKRQSLSSGLQPEENEDFVFLKSTPFSLTKPLFRHGPITLSKADMGKAVITMDDTMDWTAFQVAILGGAGGLFPEENMEEDSKLMEDLADWYDDFGFESLGGLVVAEAPSSRSSSRSTVSSARSTDDDLPIPIHCEEPSGFWNVASGALYDKAKFYRRSGGPRTWKADGGDPSLRRHTAESPPQSPMLPIVAGDDGRDGVPMGYNLNHDLGDFLAWEAAHVTVPGF